MSATLVRAPWMRRWPEAKETERASLWMPIAWGVGGVVVVGGCVAWLGAAMGLSSSEFASLSTFQVIAFPLGFAATGAVAGPLVHWLLPVPSPSRVSYPLALAWMGGIGMFLLVNLALPRYWSLIWERWSALLA